MLRPSPLRRAMAERRYRASGKSCELDQQSVKGMALSWSREEAVLPTDARDVRREPQADTHNDDSQSGMASGRSTEFLLIVPPDVSGVTDVSGSLRTMRPCRSSALDLSQLLGRSSTPRPTPKRSSFLSFPQRRPHPLSLNTLTPVTQPPPRSHSLPFRLRRLANFAQEIFLLFRRDEIRDAGVSGSVERSCGRT